MATSTWPQLHALCELQDISAATASAAKGRAIRHHSQALQLFNVLRQARAVDEVRAKSLDVFCQPRGQANLSSLRDMVLGILSDGCQPCVTQRVYL